MSNNSLLMVEEATIEWQGVMQQNQFVTATTVDQAATTLMSVYALANSDLDKLMHTDTIDKMNGDKYTHYHPYNGKPGDTKNTADYSTQVNTWQTYYNKTSQEWSNLENTWNTPIQSLDTQEQTLGNNAQQATQNASIVTQASAQTANLLQSQL